MLSTLSSVMGRATTAGLLSLRVYCHFKIIAGNNNRLKCKRYFRKSTEYALFQMDELNAE